MIRARTEWVIRKRDGRVAAFDSGLIGRAIANAFRAELNLANQQPLDAETDEEIRSITDDVADEIGVEAGTESGTDVERVQDLVDFVVARICDQLRVENHLISRWGEQE